MKLKELPKSLLHSWQLRLVPLASLGKAAKPCSEPVIVSLTSIESRLNNLHLTARSLLQQSMSTQKIYIWLHKDLEQKIPTKLAKLVGDKVEICFTETSDSHRKLVEPLRRFLNKIIVTCDDDVLYPRHWLEKLIESHREFPNDIIAHECRNILCDKSGETTNYLDWPDAKPGESRDETMSIGYGGVMYPANSLHQDVTDQSLYTTLAPKADDLWFKAMSLLNGRKVRRSLNPPPKPTPLMFTQKSSLKRYNIQNNGNREQWRRICEHYQLQIPRND